MYIINKMRKCLNEWEMFAANANVEYWNNFLTKPTPISASSRYILFSFVLKARINITAVCG